VCLVLGIVLVLVRRGGGANKDGFVAHDGTEMDGPYAVHSSIADTGMFIRLHT
jgi:hypothetical protein